MCFRLILCVLLDSRPWIVLAVLAAVSCTAKNPDFDPTFTVRDGSGGSTRDSRSGLDLISDVEDQDAVRRTDLGPFSCQNDSQCNDGRFCTRDLCDRSGSGGQGVCVFLLRSEACLIDGECWLRCVTNPNNARERCEPDRARRRWSVIEDNSECPS